MGGFYLWIAVKGLHGIKKVEKHCVDSSEAEQTFKQSQQPLHSVILTTEV